MRLEAKGLGVGQKRVGRSELSVAAVGDTLITREVMQPGWRWSIDMAPVVGTELCQALHQAFVVSGQLHILTADGAEVDLRAGDAAVIPPGHDGWVVGDEPCEFVDFSPTYVQLIEAGEALHALAGDGGVVGLGRAARRLRAEARAGRLDAAAVELVLGAVGHRPGGSPGPAGLTPREVEVLVLIATGASVKQVAYALGIAPKTASAHVQRIYAKCGVSSRSAATHFAIAHGLVKPLAP